jgi:hypothetical protein
VAVKAMWGNKFIAGLLDMYLGRVGYRMQQTQEPEDPGRPDNLYRPLKGDHGPHGTFAKRSYNHSVEEWFSKYKWFGLAALGAGAVGLGIWARRSTLTAHR